MLLDATGLEQRGVPRSALRHVGIERRQGAHEVERRSALLYPTLCQVVRERKHPHRQVCGTQRDRRLEVRDRRRKAPQSRLQRSTQELRFEVIRSQRECALDGHARADRIISHQALVSRHEEWLSIAPPLPGNCAIEERLIGSNAPPLSLQSCKVRGLVVEEQVTRKGVIQSRTRTRSPFAAGLTFKKATHALCCATPLLVTQN